MARTTRGMGLVFAAALSVIAMACGPRVDTEVARTQQQKEAPEMDPIAESYVKLVLAVGLHDSDYVDAYYGPEEWKREVDASKPSLEEIEEKAGELLGHLEASPAAGPDEMTRLRHSYLVRQLESLAARVSILGGEKLTFDEESRALYDAEAPHFAEEHFREKLATLENALPGDSPIAERYETFRNQFVIPQDRLDTVFRAAIDACRERTARFLELPPGESFTVEYVTDKSWSGYNWYQGNFNSLIQVNTDLPIHIDRAIDLACHEGYPGHHLYNTLLEQHLVKDRGWREYSVYPLFSPQSLIAEGTANYGVDIAFSEEERILFEREMLFPLAGLDPAKAKKYYEIQELASELSYAGNEAARRYLNGEMDAAGAADWLNRYALMSPARAKQRVRFIDQYRSYVINYNWGKDLVKQYVEAEAGASPEEKWRVFKALLASPRLPSDLRRATRKG